MTRGTTTPAWAAIAALVACFVDPPAVEDSESGDATGSSTGAGTAATADTGTTGSGHCGDGVVDPGEECDLGPENAPRGACKLDCTVQICGDGEIGPSESCDDANDVENDGCSTACRVETCGDGMLQEGEVCDDANDEDGDGCNRDCHPSGTLVWEHVHPGAMGGDDIAHDLAFMGPAALIVAVGEVIDAGVASEPWLRLLDPNGLVVHTSPSDDADDTEGTYEDVDCRDTCVAVRRVGSAGAAAAVAQYVGPAGLIDKPTALAYAGVASDWVQEVILLPDESVEVVGQVKPDGQSSFYGVLDTLDASLVRVVDEPTMLTAIPSRLRNLAAAGEHRVVSGYLESSAPQVGVVVRIDPRGSTTEFTVQSDQDYSFLMGMAVMDDGSVLIAGYGSDTSNGKRALGAILRRYLPDNGLAWSRDGSFGEDGAFFGDVAILGNGDFVAVGSTNDQGVIPELTTALLTRWSPDAQVKWTTKLPTASHAAGVAIDPATDAIYVSGWHDEEGGDQNAWVARFTP